MPAWIHGFIGELFPSMCAVCDRYLVCWLSGNKVTPCTVVKSRCAFLNPDSLRWVACLDSWIHRLIASTDVRCFSTDCCLTCLGAVRRHSCVERRSTRTRHSFREEWALGKRSSSRSCAGEAINMSINMNINVNIMNAWSLGLLLGWLSNLTTAYDSIHHTITPPPGPIFHARYL